MTAARWSLVAVALALALLGAAPAQAGTIAFGSARCVDGADRQTRPDFYVIGPPACASAIWAIEDDGTNLRRLTSPKPYKGHAAAAWSPDGHRLAYSAEGGVWVANADGSEPRRVIEGDSLAWSPDGLSLVVTRDTTTRDGNGETIPGSRELLLVTLDGAVTRQLTHTSEDEIVPGLSNDGTKIVFTRTLSGYQHFKLLRPGGAVIPPELRAREGLFQLDLITGKEERLLSTDIPFDTQFGARFSPDGRQLEFSSGFSIYTMNRDGSDLRRRTAPQTAIDAVWAGAGALAMIRVEPHTSGIVRLDLTSGTTAAVTPMEQLGPGGLAWKPAGGLDALEPPVDAAPPALGLMDGSTGKSVGSRRRPRAAAAAAARAVRRSDLRYLAADPSGLKATRVAFGRRGRRRCRFLARRGWTRLRSCRRPVYRAVTGPEGWRALTRRLRFGRYVLYSRTRDARGNRSRKGRRVYLTIRR